MFKKLLSVVLLAIPLACLGAGESFVLTDTAGKTHSLAEHRGKWVLVNLWATWCRPCIDEMPELEALSKSRSDLVVLGLAVDGQNPRRIVEFAQKLHVTYPIIAGSDELARQFKPRGFPTTFLYDPTGEQAWVKEGRTTRSEIEQAMQHSPRRAGKVSAMSEDGMRLALFGNRCLFCTE